MNNQKTVLFFPLNSPGHINSSLGIADILKEEHGYNTVFLLLGPQIGTSIRDHGHELVIVNELNALKDYEVSDDENPLLLDEAKKMQQGRTKKEFPGFMKWPQIIQREKLKMDPVDAIIAGMKLDKMMLAELIENYDNYAEAIERIKPDLVIVDAYYLPPCVVNLKHIPWVRLFSANPMMMLKSKLPNGIKPPAATGFSLLDKERRAKLRAEDPSAWNEMVDKWQAAIQRIVEASGNTLGLQHDFYKKYGCEPLRPGQLGHDSPHLNVYMFPQAIDYDQDDDLFEYPPRWFRCDSLVRKPISETDPFETKLWNEILDDGMKGKKEVVFFSLGSIASGNVDLMKRYVDMFRNDRHRLYVISKGVNGDKYKLNGDNMIGRNYLPQTFFLERADLAIIHGGNNSVTECFYYGVPMIILPVFADQYDNAQRVEDLGLGKRLDAFDCTGEQLNQAIEEVLYDTKLVERIRDIGRSMRARKDPLKLSLMLKKLIEHKHLDSEFIEQCRNQDFDELAR